MKRSILLILVTVFTGGCDSFVTEIDEYDITRARDADLKQALIAAEVAYIGALEGDMARISGLWSGYFNGVNSYALGYYNYTFTSSSTNTVWSNVYASALKNLRVVQEKAIVLQNKSTLGIAQVMEASLIGTATAVWGDVPWSEAANVSQYPNPHYDPQLAVIDSLIVLLDSAAVNLAGTSARDGDFFFATTAPNSVWVSIANSVKARLLLYKQDYSAALLAANNGIQTPSGDLNGRHGTGNGDMNMYYSYLQLSAWAGHIKASNTLLGKLLNPTEPGNRNHAKTNEAVRLGKYYTGTSVADYTPNTSVTGFFAQAASFPLHTASETKLIVAECLIKQSDFAEALLKLNEHRTNLRTVYPTGTYADFVATDFDPGNIENLASLLTPSEALLREILEEKFVCLYGQVEAFNELRRSKNAIGLAPNIGVEIPQRFLYPQAEINANVNTPNPIPGLFEKTAIFQ